MNLYVMEYKLEIDMANKKLITESNMSIEQKALGLLACVAQEQKVEVDRLISGTALSSYLQLHILHTLSFAPEKTLTVNQLKAAMIDESPNVSRALNKLVDMGMIVKNRSAEDQRTVFISITDLGEREHHSADEKLMTMSTNLNEAELSQLYELLQKF